MRVTELVQPLVCRRMAGVIQVPSGRSERSPQRRTTSPKAVSIAYRVAAVAQRAGQAARDVELRRSRITARGSGDHQRMGWPSAYQGKMPRRYAASSRAGDRSPPAHKQPVGLVERRFDGREAVRRIVRSQPGNHAVRAALEGQVSRPPTPGIPPSPPALVPGSARSRPRGAHRRASAPNTWRMGSNPRASLCSPCVPGSNRARPCSMQYSMPW